MSTDSLKVLIIAGGLTHERDVSVRSGRRVANSLINQGFDAKVVDFDQNLPAEISAFGPDVVWPQPDLIPPGGLPFPSFCSASSARTMFLG